LTHVITCDNLEYAQRLRPVPWHVVLHHSTLNPLILHPSVIVQLVKTFN